MDAQTHIAPSALIEPGVTLGKGVTIWHHAHVREDSTIGDGSMIGEGAHIDKGVIVGKNVKVQNQALLYAPATLADGVFIGPAAVLTNDRSPRAITPSGEKVSAEHWAKVGVLVGRGASIGARAVCIAPLTIGPWSMVGAGAVVTRDVAAHALVVGTPARQIGWVGRSGSRLICDEDAWMCPSSGERYVEVNGSLRLSSPDALQINEPFSPDFA